MARKVKSIKGEVVDFDLLKTKEQLGEKERVLEVRDREDFVHTKRRTRGRAALLKRLNKNKKAREESSKEESKASESKIEASSKTETKKTKKKRKIVKKD